MTIKELNREDELKHLLEAPAPIVVGKLVAELRKYVAFAYDIKSFVDRCGALEEDVINELLEKHEI